MMVPLGNVQTAKWWYYFQCANEKMVEPLSICKWLNGGTAGNTQITIGGTAVNVQMTNSAACNMQVVKQCYCLQHADGKTVLLPATCRS